MQLEINLDPEQIEQYIVQAVIDSALGDVVKEEVQKALDSLREVPMRRRGVIAVAIEAEIQKIVLQVLRNEYTDKLRAAVREQMTETYVNTVVSAAVQAVHDKL